MDDDPVVAMLHTAAARDSSNMRAALLCAAVDGDVAGMQAALATFSPGEMADVQGTALHVACRAGRAECVRVLLEAGADPNVIQEDEGEAWHCRPVHAAAVRSVQHSSSSDCVALLLQHGADPLALDCFGSTALHYAFNLELARLLLRAAPAAALVRNNKGFTPTQALIDMQCSSSAQLLLAEAPLQPAAEIVQVLDATLSRIKAVGQYRVESLLPLAPILVARTGADLGSCDWYSRNRSMMITYDLIDWLPAMLQHSDVAAARLMAFLPAPERSRLGTAALCLARAGRSLSAPLPVPIVRRLLAQAAERPACRSQRQASEFEIMAIHLWCIALVVLFYLWVFHAVAPLFK